MVNQARRKRRAIAAAVCGAVLSLFAPAPASAGVLKVPATAFRPAVTGTRYFEMLATLGTTEASARFSAPIRIPDGARITGVEFFHDSLGAGQVTVSLVRLDPADTPSAPATVCSQSNVALSGLVELPAPHPSDALVLKRYSHALVADLLFGGVLKEVRVRYVGP